MITSKTNEQAFEANNGENQMEKLYFYEIK